MKKLSLILIVLAMFACKKDEPITEHSFFVDIKEKWSANDEPTYVGQMKTVTFIFKDNGKEIDYEKTTTNIRTDQKLYFKDGTSLKEEFSSIDPIMTFENVPDGNYVIWVFFKYSDFFSFQSSTKITVSESTHLKQHVKIFRCYENFGYQTW
ncbi:MAG TPA: hypothetical protein GXZ87_07010 [Bacteroidales bacterium]|nr:hypothetical protein [Bacteroidales bacterium]